MTLRALIFAFVASATLALAAPSAFADQIVTHTIDQGGNGSVNYSYLTVGSNLGGGSSQHIWRVSGNVDLTFNNLGTQILGINGVVSVWEGGVGTGTVVGHVNFVTPLVGDPALFTQGDQLGGATDALGVMRVTLSAVGASSAAFLNSIAGNDEANIGFADTSYYGTDFNSIGTEEISLWGNEMVMAAVTNSAYTTNGYTGQAGNWGFDWHSTRVPEPGTIALFGLGLLGLAVVRRRRA